MPLRASSINFVGTNNHIDSNRINLVSKIESGHIYNSKGSSTVGGNSLCWGPKIHASSVVERRCYSSQDLAWPHSCLLAAGTNTVTGKFSPETFSQSQWRQGCGTSPDGHKPASTSQASSSWLSRERFLWVFSMASQGRDCTSHVLRWQHRLCVLQGWTGRDILGWSQGQPKCLGKGRAGGAWEPSSVLEGLVSLGYFPSVSNWCKTSEL